MMVSPNTTVVTIMDNTSKMKKAGRVMLWEGGGEGWCRGGHGGGGGEEVIRNTHSFQYNTFHRIMYVNLLCLLHFGHGLKMKMHLKCRPVGSVV